MAQKASAKNSFVVFTDWAKPMRNLPLDDVGRLFLAMVDYTESGEVPEIESPSAAMAFEFIRLRLDDNRQKWEEVRRKRSRAGKLGAAATNGKTQQTAANPANADSDETLSANPAVPVPVPVPVNFIGAEPPQQKRFIPPTVEKVAAYCREIGAGIDPNAFVDYYSANGWVQGKGKPIKDWRAAVRNWARNTRQAQPQQPRKERWERDL